MRGDGNNFGSFCDAQYKVKRPGDKAYERRKDIAAGSGIKVVQFADDSDLRSRQPYFFCGFT